MNKYIFAGLLLCITTDAMALSLTSKDFVQGGALPQIVACDGKNISPDLSWTDIPAGTKSLALTLEDPDAPMAGGFDHWVLFNLPPDLKGLSQGMTDFPKGTGMGSNGTKKTGYYGPCPPTGKHRYYFRLYALDKALELPEGATKQQVLDALKGHVVGQTELMGTYEKAKK